MRLRISTIKTVKARVVLSVSISFLPRWGEAPCCLIPMYSLASTLLALPVLLIVSLPLILSAWITTSFALATLLLWLTVVYLRLLYGLLVNILSIPTPTSSLLTFAASEPSTPGPGTPRPRRNSAYGLIQPRISNTPLSSSEINEVHKGRTRRQQKSYARSMVEAHCSPSMPFSGLPISGDERRDFEGVGGWRSYPDKHHGSPSRKEILYCTSPSSVHTTPGDVLVDPDTDADESAWLSLNHRLELPHK